MTENCITFIIDYYSTLHTLQLGCAVVDSRRRYLIGWAVCVIHKSIREEGLSFRNIES